MRSRKFCLRVRENENPFTSISTLTHLVFWSLRSSEVLDMPPHRLCITVFGSSPCRYPERYRFRGGFACSRGVVVVGKPKPSTPFNLGYKIPPPPPFFFFFFLLLGRSTPRSSRRARRRCRPQFELALQALACGAAGSTRTQKTAFR